MLNAIIRERYDNVRQVYEIDVIKVVQSHFEIEAVDIQESTPFAVTLIKGATDRLEIETPPPCSIPGVYRINYKIRCSGMVCRDASWNDAYVIFEIPEDEMCPSVSVTYSPSMDLKLCADAACSTDTTNHILGYVMTMEAKVTMAAPILMTRFYEVAFTDSATGLGKLAKDAYTVTDFGNFLQYSDVDGDSTGVSTADFTPKKGTGDDAFFYTPDIFTSKDYGVKVTMYVEADLTQSVKKAFLVSKKMNVATEMSARSFSQAKSAISFSDEEAESESNTTVVVVVVVAVAVVVASAVAVFMFRRRAALSKTEHHVNMEPVTTA
jgi:hypothetical protein